MGFFDLPKPGPGLGPRPDESNVWKGLGDFFGGVGGAIGDSFQRMTPGFAKQHSAVYRGNHEAAHPVPSVDIRREFSDGGPVPKAPYSFSGNVNRGGHDDIPSDSAYAQGPPPPSPLEILMEQLQQQYHAPDPSKMDFSSLDKALSGRLGYIHDAENQIKGNFDKSDLAVQLMHDAMKHDVETTDKARYNQISDTQESGLRNNLKMSTDNLSGQRAAYMAEKQAMLKNLGQEAVAGAPDQNEQIFNDGIATATRRNGIDMSAAEQGRATNQAYNTGVAQSIGQAGIQRRSALQQQLQGLLGKASMAESEAKAQDQQQRQAAISGQNDTAYRQWNDNQNRLKDIFNTLTDEGVARDKMAMGNQAAAPTKGMAGLVNTLTQGGMDPQSAQAGIAALNAVLTGGNYLEGARGVDPNNLQPYDQKQALIRKLKEQGLPDDIATQVGLAY